MKLIANNQDLITALSGKLTILSGRLSRLDIFDDADQGLSIDIYINLLYSDSQTKIKIRFQKIESYSFYYTKDNYFYYIERFKFFQQGEYYYFALDPYDENSEINSEDQDYILCNSIEGYFI